MTVDLDRLLACAVKAARAAGDYALSQSMRRREIIRSLPHDVKLKLDVESQTEAENVIRDMFPDHPILGEEAASKSDCEAISRIGIEFGTATDAWMAVPGSQIADNIRWLIDPIDGTVNFMHGLPLWCCSVAAAMDNKIVAGAVYAPALNECYAAKAGGAATCNDTPISVSGVARISEAMVATGMDRNVGRKLPPFEIFKTIAASAQKARIMGSAALDLCYLARGYEDGYFEKGVYVWDVAAGSLIVSQAGGKTELLGVLPDNQLCFLATNGRIHKELRDLISPKLAL